MRTWNLSLVLLAAVVSAPALAWQAGQQVKVTTNQHTIIVGTVMTETERGLLLKTATATVLVPFEDVADLEEIGAPAAAPPQLQPAPSWQPPVQQPPERQPYVDPRIELRRQKLAAKLEKEQIEKAREEADDLDPTLRRVRFYGAASLGAGTMSYRIMGSVTNGDRCVPCLNSAFLGEGEIALGVAIPFTTKLWARVGGATSFGLSSGNGAVSIAGYTTALNWFAHLNAELHLALTPRISVGLGGLFGLNFFFPAPEFGGVLIGSYRLSSHHRLGLAATLLTATGGQSTRGPSASYTSSWYTLLVETRTTWHFGLTYEYQF